MFIPIVFFLFLLGYDYAEGSQCPVRMRCALRLTYGGSGGSLLAVHSTESKISVIVDSENDMSLLTDGHSGFQFIYKHRENKGIQIKMLPGHSWSAQSNMLQYIESLRSLTHIRITQQVKIQEFIINSPPDNIIDAHINIIKILQPEMFDYVKIRKIGGFSILINLIKEMSKLKREVLREIIDSKMKMKTFVIAGGFMNVVSTFRGISVLIKETSGQMGRIIIRNPNFDLGPLFISDSGSESLAIIVEQINEPNSPVFQIVKNPPTVYKIVREFGGGIYSGTRGIETLVYHLIFFLNKQITMEAFIDVVIQVTASFKQINYETIIHKIDYIERILKKKMAPAFSYEILHKFEIFKQNKLVIEQVNIPYIVKLFLKGGEPKIKSAINLLFALRTDYLNSLTTLLLRLTFFTLTEQGVYFSVGLFPKLKTLINFNSKESIIVQIVRNINPAILQGGIDLTTIRRIPIIGQIYTGIIGSMTVHKEQRDVWMKMLVKQEAFTQIFSWIKFGAGIQGGQEPRGCIHDMGLWALASTSGCVFYD
ncbi:uncharacterized protein LOC123316258 [Coccinella septempunctata]|uniref:uncharacterized protein LOC123316258 n=1 Tax=Coccinella septempunctata TaxID=41139 RepID=UPI001D06148A|nr:uncharacterized protein LOC123316258 [Coccinella septempunctata]